MTSRMIPGIGVLLLALGILLSTAAALFGVPQIATFTLPSIALTFPFGTLFVTSAMILTLFGGGIFLGHGLASIGGDGSEAGFVGRTVRFLVGFIGAVSLPLAAGVVAMAL